MKGTFEMKLLMAVCVINAMNASVHALSPSVGLGVKVVDESNRVFAGIPVTCVFPDKTRFGADDYSIVTNMTGNDGIAWFHGRASNGWVEYGMIKKEGFYSIDAIRTRFANVTGTVSKEWLPYNDVQTITLQQFIKPIPLWVRNDSRGWTHDLTTAPDKKFSYDFVKGDWMPPFGKGEHADLEFKSLPREDFGMGMGPSGIPDPAFRDTISAEFIGQDNGVVKVTPPPNAVLKVRTAPHDGYGRSFRVWYGRTKTMQIDKSLDDDACHVFRIRTVKDRDGKIISALYGKVYGGFALTYKVEEHPSGVSFTYYLNPTPNDRNLEWDMEHNLCPTRESFNQP